MEFDCWTGLRIEGKSYIIAEKICYKEKASDDVWTEYGLITSDSDARIWLTVADNGLSYSLSTLVKESKPPKGYRLHDTGTQVVTGVWGDTDASVGDEAKYEQYESADGTATFFVEKWSVNGGGSAGKKLNAADIVPDESTAPPRWNAFRFRLKNGLREVVTSVAACGVILLFVIFTEGAPDLSARTWHDFRNFVGVPYALHERLSDAPYYTEEQDEGGARIYTAQMDAGTVALDLIEGLDGEVQDVTLDTVDAEVALVLRARMEIAHIVPAPDGTTRIVLTDVRAPSAPIPVPPSAETYRDRDAVLLRYAALVRSGNERGRTAVVAEDEAASAIPTPTPTAAPVTPAPTESVPPTTDGTPRRNLHLAN